MTGALEMDLSRMWHLDSILKTGPGGPLDFQYFEMILRNSLKEYEQPWMCDVLVKRGANGEALGLPDIPRCRSAPAK